MASKFGKFLLFSGTVGIAAMGAYYYMQKKDSKVDSDNDCNDMDDLDNFSEDLDDEDEQTTDTVPPKTNKKSGSRSYVSLDLNLDNAKEVVASTIDKTVDFMEGITAKTLEKVEEFFDDEADTTNPEDLEAEEIPADSDKSLNTRESEEKAEIKQ